MAETKFISLENLRIFKTEYVDEKLKGKVNTDDNRLTDARPASDVHEWAKAENKPSYTASEVGAIDSTLKGAANGVAELDSNGKVPSSLLPSYVDDVIEAANFASLPATGEDGKIYVTLDDNKTFRWSGSTYVEISASLTLGETTGTAYDGKKGKDLKDSFDLHAADTDIHITSNERTAWNAKYDKPATGIPATDMSLDVQDSLALANTAIQNHLDISGKAEKSELTITPGTGDNADKTTIQLKEGVSATVLTAHQDITGKVDKVSNPTSGNFAGLDNNGNLTDSGKKAADFATAAQGTKADSAIQGVSVNNAALTPDANKNVNITIPVEATAAEVRSLWGDEGE